MSIRYSGDAEIRLTFDRKKRIYRGRVVDAHLQYNGWVPVPRAFTREPTSSEAYDAAAVQLAKLARRWARSQGWEFLLESTGDGIFIRRGFQAPCPLEDF